MVTQHLLFVFFKRNSYTPFFDTKCKKKNVWETFLKFLTKNNLSRTQFSFRNDFFSFFLFSSIQEKHFLRTNTCVLSFFLSDKKSSVFWKWISLDFLFFFLSSFSSILVSSILVFVHNVSHSSLFSFPFLSDLLFPLQNIARVHPPRASRLANSFF